MLTRAGPSQAATNYQQRMFVLLLWQTSVLSFVLCPPPPAVAAAAGSAAESGQTGMLGAAQLVPDGPLAGFGQGPDVHSMEV